MAKPLYISFFTAHYAESARELITTLDAFELEHDVADVSRVGNDWMANVQRKPLHILAMMEKYPDRPLVWIDADARVRRQPVLFQDLANRHVDFAAHWLEKELLSGTMYFGPTDAAMKLATAWTAMQQAHPEMVDQETLRVLLECEPKWLHIERLPAVYTAIFDHQRMGPSDHFVIEHLQYSRKFRQSV